MLPTARARSKRRRDFRPISTGSTWPRTFDTRRATCARDPPHLASYGGRGPLGGWVAVCAQRLALTALARREETAFAGAEPLERAVAGTPDPELQIARAHLRQDFEQLSRLSSQSEVRAKGQRFASSALGAAEVTLFARGVRQGAECRNNTAALIEVAEDL